MSYSLHWLVVNPNHIHDFLFRSLAADPEIDLLVHFCEPALSIYPWMTKMAHGFNSRTFQRILGLDWYLFRQGFSGKRSFFVIAGWDEPTNITLIDLLSARRRPFAIWTDTPQLNRPRSFLKEVFRSAWLKWTFGCAYYVMGTGKPALAALSQMGCPADKLVDFPFAVDLEFFSPRSTGVEPENGPVTFLSCGRLLNSEKGHDQALKALARVRDRLDLQPHQFRYRIAGTGPDQGVLSSLSHRLGLADQVEFVGWLEPAQLSAFYRSGEVLLHPSLLDPFPNAILEAMACGLAVIGSDAAGSAIDRIKHGENGLLHRAGDIDHLADQIAFLIKNPKKIAIMGAKARATAEEWPIGRHIALIKGMLHNSL
jgi:glycosyltransferase involved in cell wall biosynthesis